MSDRPHENGRVAAPAAEADVCVVGAGLAGLVAATKIAAAGRSVVVLEARDRVGGRILNHDLGGGKGVELGGQWIGPTQDRMYALARELDVASFPTYCAGDTIAVIEGRRYRFAGEMPRLNPLALVDLAQAVFRLERLARGVPLDKPWEARGADSLDATTFDTWLRRNTRTRKARAVLTSSSPRPGPPSPPRLAPPRALLHPLRHELRRAHERVRRRPAGPTRRRFAAPRAQTR